MALTVSILQLGLAVFPILLGTLQVGHDMFLQSFGHGKPLSTLLAYVRLLSGVRAAVILQQSHGFTKLATVRAGVSIRAEVILFMARELRGLAEGLATDGTLEGLLLYVGFLMGHELGGVGEVAVANITGEKGVSQDALLILCRVARLQVALFALMIAEDYVALNTLQGELGR